MGKATKEEAQELLWEYGRRFNDSFPTMAFPGDSYDETCRKVKTCLESGEPYKLDIPPGIRY